MAVYCMHEIIPGGRARAGAGSKSRDLLQLDNVLSPNHSRLRLSKQDSCQDQSTGLLHLHLLMNTMQNFCSLRTLPRIMNLPLAVSRARVSFPSNTHCNPEMCSRASFTE